MTSQYHSLTRQLKHLQDLIDTSIDQLEKLELRVTQIEDYLENQSEEEDARDFDAMSISDNTSTTTEPPEEKDN